MSLWCRNRSKNMSFEIFGVGTFAGNGRTFQSVASNMATRPILKLDFCDRKPYDHEKYSKSQARMSVAICVHVDVQRPVVLICNSHVDMQQVDLVSTNFELMNGVECCMDELGVRGIHSHHSLHICNLHQRSPPVFVATVIRVSRVHENIPIA